MELTYTSIAQIKKPIKFHAIVIIAGLILSSYLLYYFLENNELTKQ